MKLKNYKKKRKKAVENHVRKEVENHVIKNVNQEKEKREKNVVENDDVN